MFRVFLTENSVFSRYAPVNAQTAVEYAYTSVSLGMIELIALVQEHCGLAEYGESVCKTLGDEELTVVVLGQLNGYMPAVCGRAFTNVNCDVKHGSFYASH